jgi:hypothetical protein
VIHVCRSWFSVLIWFPRFQSLVAHPARIGFFSSAIVLVRQTRDPRFVFAQVSRTRSHFAMVRVRCLILAGSSRSVFSVHEKLLLYRSLARASFFSQLLSLFPLAVRPGTLVPLPLQVTFPFLSIRRSGLICSVVICRGLL